MAKKTVKPTCEFGRQLLRREIELGFTREQSLEALGLGSPQTFINWMRGQQPGPEWYSAFEEFFAESRPVILGWLGHLSAEEVSAIRTGREAMGLYLGSPVRVAA